MGRKMNEYGLYSAGRRLDEEQTVDGRGVGMVD